MIVVEMNLNRPITSSLLARGRGRSTFSTKPTVLRKPAVINISLSALLSGSHDGKDIQALAIDNLISADRAMVVCSAGKCGQPIHLGL